MIARRLAAYVALAAILHASIASVVLRDQNDVEPFATDPARSFKECKPSKHTLGDVVECPSVSLYGVLFNSWPKDAPRIVAIVSSCTTPCPAMFLSPGFREMV